MPSDISTAPPDALHRLFRPRSVALVGATERSIWSRGAIDNLQRFGFQGPIHLVNPKGGRIFGREAATRCAAIGEPVDVALLMVPESALEETIADLAAAGIGGAVILSSGFAELGAAGAERQRHLAATARAAGIRLLGPNCLGYVNYGIGMPLWGTQLRRPLAGGQVAVVSQSGATAAQISQFAYQQRVALTHMISTGNEADVDIADAIDHLVTQPEVKSIALFMETARRPAAFIAAADRARAAGKPIVVLKVGASEAAAQAAQAHTGSLVGDDRVFNAVCRQHGLFRVHSLEDMVVTADLMARLGPLPVPGLALVAMSGGMCEIATDQAERDGVRLARLSAETTRELRAVLPEMATPGNPLDITGAAMLNPELIEKALAVLGRDPDVGLVSFIFDAPLPGPGAEMARPFINHVGAGIAAAAKPGLMVSYAFMPVPAESRAMVDAAGVAYSGAGLSHALTAIGHLQAWSQAARQTPATPDRPAPVTARPAGERQVLSFLAQRGVPVLPSSLTRTAEEAASEAARLGGPVVLKIASPDIAHKTEVGGVALNLQGSDIVQGAWRAMMDRVVSHRPDARIDGILVTPMRDRGIELFVGTMRDPQWGPVIAVGLGGIFVELLKDTSLRLLPVSEQGALDMLAELKGSALLDGFRGAAPVNRTAVARAVAAIGDAALALGDDLVSLEVNPLLATDNRVEALDGLTIWREEA